MMGSGLGFGIPGLGMLIFWGILIIFVVWLVKGITGDRRHSNGRTALEILEERFARDEISREEYEEKKKVLT